MKEEQEIPPDQEIDFCTMGMFIIDEIHFLPPTPPVFNILGGSGSYSALGARLFSPPPISRTISWIVDLGSDFPSSLTSIINSWSTSCLLRPSSTRLTTRGWNGYDASQNRAFKYTTPKLRLDEKDLPPQLLFAKSFHLNCNPTRCIQLVQAILRRRKQVDPTREKPLFIWEPVPDLCVPDELLNATNALPYVDIMSPNHAELAGFMGDPDLGVDPLTGTISSTAVERACEQLLGSMPLQSYAIVVRCGERGCYIAKNGGRSRRPSAVKRKRPKNHERGGLTLDMDIQSLFSGLLSPDGSFDRDAEQASVQIEPDISRWLPAYFEEKDKDRVVDPTGGGNGFLGGLAVALARGHTLESAACHGTISASFCIEQVGVPTLNPSSSPTSPEKEAWNGESVQGRLEEYMARVGITG